MKERKNFVEAIQTQSNKRKTLTENAAIAYETTGKYLLDFNFKLSQRSYLLLCHLELATCHLELAERSLLFKILRCAQYDIFIRLFTYFTSSFTLSAICSACIP